MLHESHGWHPARGRRRAHRSSPCHSSVVALSLARKSRAVNRGLRHWCNGAPGGEGRAATEGKRRQLERGAVVPLLPPTSPCLSQMMPSRQSRRDRRRAETSWCRGRHMMLSVASVGRLKNALETLATEQKTAVGWTGQNGQMRCQSPWGSFRYCYCVWLVVSFNSYMK